MNEIIDNPKYLAYRFDFGKESIEFLPISDAEIRSVAWLKHSVIDPNRQLISIPLSEIQQHLARQQMTAPKLLFIFHTAYCASTYLARCLDINGQTISLKEPQLLLDVANAKRLQWKSQTTEMSHNDLPALALRLLQKYATNEQRLIIKPINSVNNIIPELMQAAPSSSAVVLYTDARNFILSALKKGESARQTLRAMFDLLRCDFPHLAKLRISDAIHMSDLKLMLTLWRLQIEQVEKTIGQLNNSSRICSLNAEELINNPSSTMIAVDEFLGLGLGRERLEKIVGNKNSRRDAKDQNKEFSLEQRDKIYAELEHFYGDDLANGLKWLNSNNPQTGLNPKLSSPLIVSS